MSHVQSFHFFETENGIVEKKMKNRKEKKKTVVERHDDGDSIHRTIIKINGRIRCTYFLSLFFCFLFYRISRWAQPRTRPRLNESEKHKTADKLSAHSHLVFIFILPLVGHRLNSHRHLSACENKKKIFELTLIRTKEKNWMNDFQFQLLHYILYDIFFVFSYFTDEFEIAEYLRTHNANNDSGHCWLRIFFIYFFVSC